MLYYAAYLTQQIMPEGATATKEAATIYNYIISNYPTSEFAAKAKTELGY
jgi:outer membrane protein assembly factor BamD (BamD/ComL family)